MKRATSYPVLWIRALLSALGAGAIFVILYQIRNLLPHTSRRTELVFVLMLAMILLLWSLTEASVQLVRYGLGISSSFGVISKKSSESATKIPLSTDIPRGPGEVDLPGSPSDLMRKD